MQENFSPKFMETVQPQKFVGSVLRGMNQDIIEALLTAIEADNPEAELLYEDHGGYVRIHNSLALPCNP